ncbi:MAG TPA: hypothetical protein VNX47_00455 [Nevskia sp.]|nr:hypothetical protein [Nevskia sp.]
MAKKKDSSAAALLEAHVQFMLAQLEGPALRARIEQEVDALLGDAERISLNEVVTREAVKETVRVYAVKLELNAGIPELVADIAQRLHSHGIHAKTRLRDLLSDQQFGEILDKLLEMKALRERLLDESVSNPVYSALAADIVYHGIKGYLSQNKLTGNIPGARAAMKLGKSVMNRATPGLEGVIEERLKGYVSKNIQSTLNESRRFLLDRFDPESIREVALDLWDRAKGSKVSVFRDYLRAADLEDFFVIGYEYWHALRKTDWYVTLIDAGVDGFFDRYGDSSLGEILEEIGIARDMLVADAMRFAPKAIEGLRKRGLLEGMVRRNLEDFYRSGAVEKIIGG